jgi:hypothetical protein
MIQMVKKSLSNYGTPCSFLCSHQPPTVLSIQSITFLLISLRPVLILSFLLCLHLSNGSVEITNKMQPCNRIYYSTVHWRLNIFRAAYRSSSGVLTVFAASGLHRHVMTGRSQVKSEPVPTQTWLRPVTTCVCKPEAANTVRAPDDERYAARNMLSLQRTME